MYARRQTWRTWRACLALDCMSRYQTSRPATWTLLVLQSLKSGHRCIPAALCSAVVLQVLPVSGRADAFRAVASPGLLLQLIMVSLRAGVKQRDATMAVLVMEMISSDLSFVLHTVNPLDRDETLLSAEMAVGLGETLASGTRGSPWRFAISKADRAHVVNDVYAFS